MAHLVSSEPIVAPRLFRTLLGEPEAERRIARDLSHVANVVQADLGEDLRALLLIGGYARHEGSVVDRDGALGPYNDYDLVAVVRGRPEAFHERLVHLGEQQTERVGVDVDLWPIGEHELSRLPPTLFWLDVSLGGVEVLAGDRSVLARLPEIVARDVPLDEAARLLTNRATGLALSNLEAVDRDHRRARHGHKAVLACGDACLLAADRYRPSAAARLEELERLADAPVLRDGLLEAYREAVSFRRRPDRWAPPGGDLGGWYRAVRAAIGRWHLGFEAWRVGAPEGPLAYGRWRGTIFPVMADVRAGGGLIASLRARAAGDLPVWPYLGHPRERLARVAVLLAYGLESWDCREEAARLMGLPRERAGDDGALHRALRTTTARGG